MVAVAAFLLAGPVFERHRLPASAFPYQRVTGVSRVGPTWLVGGLHGLSLGKPGGHWTSVTDQAVRALEGPWVLYGDGGLDKVDIKSNRLFYDVLRGLAKRPWVSSLSVGRGSLLLGGYGAWMERGPKGIQEFFPAELQGQPVTAIGRSGGTLWLGTQNGLFSFVEGKYSRVGLAAGLPDPWVTALVPSGDSVVVGTASGGLARIQDGKVVGLDSPSKRVRSLRRFGGRLVLGSLDGTWIREGETWQRLSDEETTFLAEIGGELVVGTMSGLGFYR